MDIDEYANQAAQRLCDAVDEDVAFWLAMGSPYTRYYWCAWENIDWHLPKSKRTVRVTITDGWRGHLRHLGFPVGLMMHVGPEVVGACLDAATDGQLAALVMEGLIKVETACGK